MSVLLSIKVLPQGNRQNYFLTLTNLECWFLYLPIKRVIPVAAEADGFPCLYGVGFFQCAVHIFRCKLFLDRYAQLRIRLNIITLTFTSIKEAARSEYAQPPLFIPITEYSCLVKLFYAVILLKININRSDDYICMAAMESVANPFLTLTDLFLPTTRQCAKPM